MRVIRQVLSALIKGVLQEDSSKRDQSLEKREKAIELSIFSKNIYKIRILFYFLQSD